jgi:hypothetical protein
MSGPSYGPGDWSYLDFVRKSMGIGIAILPDTSVWLPATYNLSLDIVNINLSAVPQVGSLTYPNQYALAVYNLAGDRLIALTPDDPLVLYPGTTVPYFEYLRNKFSVDSFVAGVVTYTSDVATSASFQVSDWMKTLSLSDLENLKTPWGRRYMAIAQQYGPTVVGIT